MTGNDGNLLCTETKKSTSVLDHLYLIIRGE